MRADWVECKIGEIFTTITGNTPSKKEIDNYDSNDIPFVKPPDVTNNVLSNVTEFISIKAKNKARILPVNSVLVTCIGNLGRVTINTNFEVAFNQQINAVIPNSFTLSKFYFYNFQSSQFRNKLEELSTSTTVALVNKSNFDTINVPLIPLPEQRAIVKKIEALFSSLDAGIADLKKAQNQLKIYRQAVLKKAFEGELTKKWRELNGFSFSLEKIKIKDLGEIVTGNTPSKSDSQNYNSEDFNFYKPTDLNKGLNIHNSTDKVSEFAYEKSRKVYKDSVLVTCIGATIGKTGLIAKEGIFNQQINAIIPNERFNSKFIYFQIIGTDFQNLLIGNSSSTTMPIINKSKFQNLDFITFSKEEQAQIVKEIEARLSVCDAVEQQIKVSLSQAEALRQSILKKAFEGKLLTEEEVKACQQEADYEPAAVLLEKIKAEKETNKSSKKTKKK